MSLHLSVNDDCGLLAGAHGPAPVWPCPSWSVWPKSGVPPSSWTSPAPTSTAPSNRRGRARVRGTAGRSGCQGRRAHDPERQRAGRAPLAGVARAGRLGRTTPTARWWPTKVWAPCLPGPARPTRRPGSRPSANRWPGANPTPSPSPTRCSAPHRALPDLLDVCCAITGRAPAVGLHLTANRAGQVLFRLVDVPLALQQDDSFYAVLGHLVGKVAQDRVARDRWPCSAAAEDQLKALARRRPAPVRWRSSTSWRDARGAHPGGGPPGSPAAASGGRHPRHAVHCPAGAHDGHRRSPGHGRFGQPPLLPGGVSPNWRRCSSSARLPRRPVPGHFQPRRGAAGPAGRLRDPARAVRRQAWSTPAAWHRPCSRPASSG